MRLLNPVCCQTLLQGLNSAFTHAPNYPGFCWSCRRFHCLLADGYKGDHLFGSFPWNCTSLWKTCFCTLNYVSQFKKLFLKAFYSEVCWNTCIFILALARKNIFTMYIYRMYIYLAMLGSTNRLVTCFQHMLQCCPCSLLWCRMIFDVLRHFLLMRPSQYKVVGLWFP